MGYRYDDKPPKPEDHLLRLAVRNGATLRAAFGCYYLKHHNPSRHDYAGWPNPHKIDRICQAVGSTKLLKINEDNAVLEKINLSEEGYDTAIIEFEESDAVQYFSSNRAYFDSMEPNIVRIAVRPNLPDFTDKPVDVRFTLFISNVDTVDAVCHGMITILPGPDVNPNS